MDSDFLQSLGQMAFTARIKRLSDSMLYDSRKYYNSSELDIEPNWHVIFLLLKHENELSVTEVAKRLRFSHPGIIKIVKKMKEKGYLVSFLDPNDQRRTLLSLSKKGWKQLPGLERKWQAMEAVIKEVVSDQFLADLAKIENKLNHLSISNRYVQSGLIEETAGTKSEI